jgi:tRNA-specific 2-thiouridylase
MYVVGKDIRTNTVTLGPEERLYTRRVIAGDVNLIAFDKLEKPVNVRAKVRGGQTEEAATVHPLEGGKVLVEFDRPQRAVTPGQAVVFYDGNIVLGGGTINSTE